jgi:chromosome segregation ATPase
MSNDNAVLPRNAKAIPDALQSFVVAVHKRSQASQHLRIIEEDLDNMRPRYADFPVLLREKEQRLSLAQEDSRLTAEETQISTTMLLDALQGFFHGNDGASSVSYSEFSALKRQLDATRAENRDLKKFVENMADRFERDGRDARRCQAQVDKQETRVHDLIDQAERDRKVFQIRVSGLEGRISKSDAKHLSITEELDVTKNTLKELGHVKQAVQDMGREIRTMAADKLTSTASAAVAGQASISEATMASYDQRLSDMQSKVEAYGDQLGDYQKQLRSYETSLSSMDEVNEQKDALMDQEMADLRCGLEDVKADMIKEIDMVKVQGRDLQKELRDVPEWKELVSRIDVTEKANSKLESGLEENKLHMDTAIGSLQTRLASGINDVKRQVVQGIPDDIKVQINHTLQTVELHVDLLQRHEVRLNSVTTDELVGMMENQWRSRFGAADQLEGWIKRVMKLEKWTKDTFSNQSGVLQQLRSELERR